MRVLSVIWLPIVIALFALGIGTLSWFFFVRSIEIPWDERHKKRPGSSKPPEKREQP